MTVFPSSSATFSTTDKVRMDGHERSSQQFFSNAQTFLSCKHALDKMWLYFTTGVLETVENVNILEKLGQNGGRQMSLDGSTVLSISELYLVAEVAQLDFATHMITTIKAAGLTTANLHIAPLKGKLRAEEKAKDDYSDREKGPAVSWLFDIVRASFICETDAEMMQIVKHFKNCSDEVDGMQLVRLKNRFLSPTPGHSESCEASMGFIEFLNLHS